MSIGPEANRLLVGFKATPENAVILSIKQHSRSQAVSFTQAHTSAADVVSLAQRAGIALAVSRQITPSMHVLFLPRTLYGVDVTTALAQLRADPAVQFAVVDQRRYALQVLPNDPAFGATANVQSGQWYLGAPTPSGQTILVEGVPTSDFSATDAVDAWTITKGSDGIVIADVDSGILFNHPDLLRAGPTSLGSGFGGRLLPGYDFVGQDFNPNSPFNGLGTYLIANDGDGWDPDPSDPGDWVSATDISNPNDLFTGDTAESSSWHGTRVVGVFGAITNNSTGVAGMTWNSWILPVRALGKGGGYDSDILAGIQWAAGLTVTNPNGSAVPKNPYPADIINLSLGGGTDACSSSNGMAYQTALTQITQMGILVVIAAGNASGPVELPANCAGTVPGVMAVAGLRNVGTKVGYSSFGAQVSVSAPAGNCVNSAGDCLRSIDTATNLGTTVPGINSYTNESNPNLGTSFATPIVSGIAALMLAVNNNLTPVQLAARLESSASPFPPNTGTGSIPVCPTLANDGSQQCACPASGQCGAGMVNAYHAVQAALEPIAAVTIAGNTLNASGSAASCGRVIQTYAWQATGPTLSGTTGSQITWSGSGTIILTVTDDHGGTDSATITVTSNSGTSAGPKSAGTAACPTVIEPNPTPPTISAAFSPASVAPNANAMLTITLSNPNAFALTQSGITETLPANLTLLTMPAPATTCTGASMSLAGATSSVTLANAIIPASGSCQITLSVNSATAANYTNMLGVNALMTGPAGGNSVASSAALAVAAPTASGGGKSGGGAFDVWDLMLVGGVLLAGRRGAKRYNRKDERSR
ncbi:MAG TPA: S8 family serine peptidase [Steroidobacteraceae bacterium]